MYLYIIYTIIYIPSTKVNVWIHISLLIYSYIKGKNTNVNLTVVNEGYHDIGKLISREEINRSLQ